MSQLSKIINYEYQGQVADLLDGTPRAPIAGYHLNYDSNNQSWAVVAVGGNLITLQNASSGTYANPTERGEVIGSPNEYKWQQIPVPGGWYKIATTDGSLSWFLPDAQDRVSIQLKPTASLTGKHGQWGYEPTPRVG